jgi:hypothetical protein
MDDLTLSAVSSLQLSQLIGNPSNGEGSNLLIEGLVAEDSNTKSDIRPSLWQKNKELSSQASKVMAVRLIFIDSLSTATASKLMSTPLAHIMMHLAQLGYMSHYIAMAEIKMKSTSGSRPRGRELLADAMTYLIHEFLVPASLRSSCVANGDIVMNNSPLRSSRPSPSQLFQSSTRGQVIIPYVWRSHEQIVKLSRADGAMELEDRCDSVSFSQIPLTFIKLLLAAVDVYPKRLCTIPVLIDAVLFLGFAPLIKLVQLNESFLI